MKISSKKPTALVTKGHLNAIIPMTIGDSRLIADLLRKHYQFPLRTSIQEYLSNARDAHRSIGQVKKIQVKLPTKNYPFFSIRDFGPGMSDEDFIEYFCKYASSSKRESDSQTGGFGLGSKIGWAYRDNFFVTNFYNGRKKMYEASTSAHYEGGLQPLEDSETTEESGFDLVLPIEPKDFTRFFEYFNLVTLFWDDLEVINYNTDELEFKKPFVFFETENIKLTMRIPLVEKFFPKEWHICFDNIIYPSLPTFSKRTEMNEREYNFQVFLKFNTSELTPTIAREYLEDAPKNFKAISKKIDLAVNEINSFRKLLREQIKEASSLSELKEFMDLYKNLFPYPFIHNHQLTHGEVKIDNSKLLFNFNFAGMSIFKINKKGEVKKTHTLQLNSKDQVYFSNEIITPAKNMILQNESWNQEVLVIQGISDTEVSYINQFIAVKNLSELGISFKELAEAIKEEIPCLSFDLQRLVWVERNYTASRINRHEIADQTLLEVPAFLLARSYKAIRGGKMLIIPLAENEELNPPTHALETFIKEEKWDIFVEGTLIHEQNLLAIFIANFKDYQIKHAELNYFYENFSIKEQLEEFENPRYNPVDPKNIFELLSFLEKTNKVNFEKLDFILKKQKAFLELIEGDTELSALQKLFEKKKLPAKPSTEFLEAIKLIAKYL